jgi:aspartate 1-decarboxylase
MRQVLRSKIHRAKVTEANVDYIGSITIDEDLLDAVGLWVGEKVLVASVDTGVRLETYTLRGERQYPHSQPILFLLPTIQPHPIDLHQ